MWKSQGSGTISTFRWRKCHGSQYPNIGWGGRNISCLFVCVFPFNRGSLLPRRARYDTLAELDPQMSADVAIGCWLGWTLSVGHEGEIPRPTLGVALFFPIMPNFCSLMRIHIHFTWPEPISYSSLKCTIWFEGLYVFVLQMLTGLIDKDLNLPSRFPCSLFQRVLPRRCQRVQKEWLPVDDVVL